jgi:hypothetical protein
MLHPAADGISRRVSAAGLVAIAAITSIGRIEHGLGAVDIRTFGQAPAGLAAAHANHPRDTLTSIALAWELESSGDAHAAEKLLLEAARLNRQHLPAWTLANFYFRRNEPAQFWPWARIAASMNPDDLRPLLRLGQQWQPDAVELARELGAAPPLLRAQLDLLIGSRDLGQVRRIADLLAAYHDPADELRLLHVSELQVE